MNPSGAKPIIRLLILLAFACFVGCVALKLDNPRILQAAIIEDKTATVFNRQPFEFKAGAGEGARTTLAVEVQYYPWQNGTLVFDPGEACIEGVGVRPGGSLARVAVSMPAGQPHCGELRLNLAKQLTQGLNEVVLQIFTKAKEFEPNAEVYVSSQLWGAHAVSTLACFCIFFALTLVIYRLAGHAGLGRTACIMLALGFATYAMILHLRPDLAYSNDLPGHLAYIAYMSENWQHPFAYTGWEHFHPPAYYFLAGRLTHYFTGADVFGPLLMVRLLGLFFYMTFCFFGLMTLRDGTTGKGIAHTIGVVLIVFWPLAPVVSTRMSNDIAVYAAWSAAFYFLAHWWREGGRLACLQWAVAFAALAFAFKTSGIIILAEVGLLGLIGLCMKRVRISDVLRKGSLLALVALLLGTLGNTGRALSLWLENNNSPSYYLSPGAGEVHPLSYFLTFNPVDYLAHPVITFDREPGFFNYFFKSMLYSEQQMGGLTLIPSVLNVLLLVFLAVIFVTTLIQPRQSKREALPYIVGALLPPLGPYVFMMIEHYMFCQNFRFIVPMLVPLVVLYVRGMKAAWVNPRWRMVYAAGIFTGVGIAVLGLGMNLWLYSHHQFG